MASIYPFRALRYATDRVALADVVTQPYDKITPAMQDEYYARSPFNLVRVILGKRESEGEEPSSVYARAASYFSDWRASGVLRPDTEPSIYSYSQRFTIPGDPVGTSHERHGFIALGKLEDYESGVIYRHEQTLSGPKTDRLNLLRSTQAHFGQIFMLYSDPAQEIEQLLSKPDEVGTAAGEQEIQVTDEYGVIHRVTAVASPSVISRVQQAMARKKLIIADGHHRYETALNYRNERRNQKSAQSTSPAPYDLAMMTFVNMDSPGLVILPTHRVIFGLSGFDVIQLVERARPFFTVNPLRQRVTAAGAAEFLRERGVADTMLIAATRLGDFLLEARKDREATDHLLSRVPADQRQLDVIQLHKILLEHVLGISEEDIRDQRHIRYVRDAEDALKQARDAEADVSFLMNPVRIEQVRDIAFAGHVLPQKSTDFFPKLLTGLTIYALS